MRQAGDGAVVAKQLDTSLGVWGPGGTGGDGAAAAWDALPGVRTTEDPTVVSVSEDRLDVFVRGGNGGVQQRTWRGSSGGWAAEGGVWRALPGSGKVRGAVAAVATANNRLSLFVRDGADNRVRHREWSAGGGWLPATSFESLGTGVKTTSPPFGVAVGGGSGGFVVFARGTKNKIFAKARASAGARWLPSGRASGAWDDLGGAGSLSGPSAAASLDQATGRWRVDLFVRGPGGDVRHKWLVLGDGADYGTSSWSPSKTGWVSLGGGATDRPSAALRRGGASSMIDVVIRAAGDELPKVRTLDLGTGVWSPSWTPLGGRRVATGAVALVATPGGGRVDAVCRAKDDGRPLHAWYDADAEAWYPE